MTQPPPTPPRRLRTFALGVVLAALAGIPASTASPVAMKNAQVELRLLRSSFGVDAVVYVRCTQALPVQGDVRLMANGRLVKIEPISTATQQVFRVRVAGSGEAVTSCATFVGETLLPDDNSVGAQSQDCAAQLPRLSPVVMTPRTQLGGGSISPLPAGGLR